MESTIMGYIGCRAKGLGFTSSGKENGNDYSGF